MKKILITLIAFIFISSVCTVTAYADTLALPPNLDGFTTDVQDASFKYAKSLKQAFSVWLDVLRGEKSVNEAVADVAELGIDMNVQLISDLVNAYDNNTITKRELVNGVVNYLLDDIKNSGGKITDFSLENGYYMIGNIIIKTFSFSSRSAALEAGFSATSYYGRDDVPYSAIGVFSPDGTMTYSVTSSSEGRPSDPGTVERISIEDIKFSYHGQGFDGYTCYHSLYYIKNGVAFTNHSTCELRLPQGLSDITPDFVSDTPDVGVLSDDDLVRYIDNIIKNLESTYPDLSTLEGKLQEVINLLKNLQNGNCSCNELAEAVYSLLSYLESSGNGNINKDLNDTLFELKNILKYDIKLDPIKNRLDDIYDVLSDISFKLDEDTTAEKVEQDIEDSYEAFKKKVEDKFQITTIKRSINNFTSCVFGKVAFENEKSTGQLMVASVYGDGSRSVSDIFYPLSLEFEYMGVTYDLFEWSGFIPATTMSTFRSFIRFVIWITFLIGLFRSLPGIIGGFGAVSAPVDKQLTDKFNEGYGD